MKFPLCLLALLTLCPAAADSGPRFGLVESIDVAPVVSDFSVGFDLLTSGNRQYVAYYDAQRRMTVASRLLDSKQWIYQVLPSKVGWDSHNYITMALDSEGHLHVSGNLHADPLVYFRTEKAGDILSLKPAAMTGELEDRTTYPRFLNDLDGRLVFTYRNGGSGNGVNLFNRYDTATRIWSRLLEKPLFDGEKLRSAYASVPSLGPDGLFHIHWVWRDTPDCATNQHLSYARSRDLIAWETAYGKKLDLPIRYGQSEAVVDPIPPGGGIINGGHRLAFDSAGKPVLAYHKADAAGNMQIFIARPGPEKWESRALTDWKTPIHFSGGGSMPFIGITVSISEMAPGVLGIGYRHKDHGSGTIQLDAATLLPLERKISLPPYFPNLLNRIESDFPSMETRRISRLDEPGPDGHAYLLQWESLGPNRDKKPPLPLPEPSMLRVHKMKAAVTPTRQIHAAEPDR